MAEGVDLEKELSCSICTDILFQPLTLLDCLHTFCGACLKEWFQFQASTATSIHPYTCPSCRASVRSTQPNATVTTLLDMFVKANPGRGKSETEKEADRDKFRPGENVMPKLRKREEPGAEEDRRLLEEVQQLSLREVGIPASSNTLEPPRERRRRDRSRDGSRSSRNSAREGHRSRSRNRPEPAAEREVIPPRVVEHQSSLRSLLSSSEIDSQEIEEEIMRQIMEEGLLDGIDLNNIDVSQEDEISERIAQAYRRRQAERQRERRERRERLAREGRVGSSPAPSATPESVRSPAVREEEQHRRRPHTRSGSGTSTPAGQGPSRPPVSRPGLIDAANNGPRSRPRSSSQGSSRSARRAERPAALVLPSNRQAAASGSESDRPATSDSARRTRRRQSDNQQRASTDERQNFRNSLQAQSSSNPNSPRRSAFHIMTTESPSSTTPTVSSPGICPPGSAPPTTAFSPPPSSRRTTDPTGVRRSRPANGGTPPTTSPPTFPRSTTDPSTTDAPSSQNVAFPTLYPEPRFSCNRCGKESIQYELHYNCSRCHSGGFNLCLACCRSGKGCRHWYGFGWAAWPRYERQAPSGGYPPNHEHPHILTGHRYQRPYAPLQESAGPTGPVLSSEDDPAHRLENGVFCDICKAFANGCYWKCDVCNEGAWGYCNDCVNQGRHCTHPLLPMAHTIGETTSRSNNTTTSPLEAASRAGPLSPGLGLSAHSTNISHTTPPSTPQSASLIRGPGLITISNMIFRPLTFTTVCNICTYPIPPSHTRFHCLQCNKGDYDICTPCYHKLVSTSRISKEDGPNGWRRCLYGHRMIVVGFEDRDGGQRRVVVRELVGGWALRDGDSSKSTSTTGGAEGQTQAQAQGPTHAPDRAATATPKYTWRDKDNSLHTYRLPHSSSTTPASPSSPVTTSTTTANPTTTTTTTTSPIQTPQRFPPNGGVGLRVLAAWSYFPTDGVQDELGFPKNAEIREAEDINGDWFWGTYCGGKGLFPGNYGRVVGGAGGGVEGGGRF
ncbi:hypothetical protein K491DRAFT_761965 [Lophiostoma macrostomum CBS 122681]|uniref:RING-type domain-containing protein n=1 Tax=Lophiostoma macrostomum CBS 122681 TaxID=1314788 RepID=A0A6A6SST4_9PLEO|nr:hypothetical protein K491DRAFT_761965 [Lophiostoma macrostomum CBS 122681]